MFRPLRKTFRLYLRWWLGELSACLPEGLREHLRPEGPTIAIAVDGNLARFDLCEGDSIYTLGEIKTDEGDAAQRRAHIARLFEVAGSSADGVDFYLNDRHVLRPRVELPAETQQNLAEVLSFEMDRYTPFKAEEVYFDHRVINVNRAQRRIAVELAVTRREEIDRLRQLADLWGIALRRVGIDGGAASGRLPFTLFRSEAAEQGRSMARRLAPALGLAACALLAVAVYLPFKQLDRSLAASEAELAKVKAAAAKVSALDQQVAAMTDQAHYLVKKKGAKPAVIQVLYELTRALPDHTWLVQFSWRDGDVTLSGFSETAASLIGNLEELAMLQKVGFSAPVTADPRVGRERFRISARVTDASAIQEDKP
ncbi:MAG TPA: PilN domain-containing protein [Kiloniellaceae bacterium]|nr:PilN domain-containing protein [Kiloniellaceae bacterium]